MFPQRSGQADRERPGECGRKACTDRNEDCSGAGRKSRKESSFKAG